MSGDRVCPQCGASVKAAMLKCMECGARVGAAVGAKPSAPRVVGAAPSTAASAPNRGPRVVGRSAETNRGGTTARVGHNRVATPRQVGAVSNGSVQADASNRRVEPAGARQVNDSETTPASAASDSGTNAPQKKSDGVLIEQCTCGNRMRVPSSWTGQKKKCRRCGAVLILGSGVQPDESGISSGQRDELEDELNQLVEKLIADVEQNTEATSLSKKASSRALSSLEKKTAIANPLSRDEAIKRRAAIIDLGKTGDPRAIPILTKSLHDSWEAVRQGVATAAGELADPAALPLALTLLTDSNAEVVRDAITALRRIGDPRSVLILLMFGQRDAALKLQVREAIVGMGEAVVSELIEIVQGRHRPIVRDAIVSLGRIGDAQAVPVLLNALD